jgi:4-aminobutyrate aminotransferase-like enzyme
MIHPKIFDATPRKGDIIETRFRRIATPLPHPDTLETLEILKDYEPISMGGQPPILWDKAQGFSVYDAFGNKWIDFSSGVLVANCGHSHPKLKAALMDQIENGVLFSYCFPNRPRAELVRRLVQLAGGRIDRCFLLTTGAEATENAIKLARTYGIDNGGAKKRFIVSFDGSFHGRTMGSQLAGGIPALKEWIAIENSGFVTAPFHDEATGADAQFSDFLDALKRQGVSEDEVCGVMAEAYQGGTGRFYPKAYMQELRKWCDEHDVLLIADEVQSGIGRTGKLFAHHHYDIEADIICCGKGLSGSLPISAVLGNSRFMSKYGPGEMTSTHSGSPICARAALASLEIIEEEGLIENSAKMGEILAAEVHKLAEKHKDVISAVSGKGLMMAIRFCDANGQPDGPFAMTVVDYCVRHGLMLYAPLGPGGGTVKINPPLMISEEALREGLSVFAEAVESAKSK